MLLENFKQEIKEKRLTKNWYTFTGIVEGKEVRLKGYNTWLQIYTINGVNYSNPMDRKVNQFNGDLLTPFV